MKIRLGQLRRLIRETARSLVEGDGGGWKAPLEEVGAAVKAYKASNSTSEQFEILQKGTEAMKSAVESYASEVDLDSISEARDKAREMLSKIDRAAEGIPERPNARRDDPVRLYAGLLRVQHQRLKKVSAEIEHSIFSVGKLQSDRLEKLEDLVKQAGDAIGLARATNNWSRAGKLKDAAFHTLNEMYENMTSFAEGLASAAKKWPKYEEFFQMIVDEAPTSVRATPETVEAFKKKLEAHPLYRETKHVDGEFDEPT